MQLKTMLGVCGLATALCLSAGSLLAQNSPGGGPGGGGGFGGGNFDPAAFQQQMQQRILDQDRQSLAITNDDEWAVIQPLIQKVLDAQQALGTGGGVFGRMGGGRGGRGGATTGVAGGAPGGVAGGPAAGPAGVGPQVSEEQTALQQAINNNAPVAEIRKALAAYRTSRKVLQDNLETAQNNLKKVLTTKQEAEAVILGLLT